ncbi:putative uncharacterized protein DDB_G0286901 [Teleopsis dalmanni]|uniref:putative uncharacterized protein DDB_G0286901 n=1 Tax=Teleopsis dalmanni TaxID=139649 RepID=UPI0018CCC50B|nr:putative uncharacterized protein DDB_G0286901 [Teleopsis dalmanni]
MSNEFRLFQKITPEEEEQLRLQWAETTFNHGTDPMKTISRQQLDESKNIDMSFSDWKLYKRALNQAASSSQSPSLPTSNNTRSQNYANNNTGKVTNQKMPQKNNWNRNNMSHRSPNQNAAPNVTKVNGPNRVNNGSQNHPNQKNVQNTWVLKPPMPPPMHAVTPETKEEKQRMWREYRQAMKPFKNREFANAKRTIQRLGKRNPEDLDQKERVRLQRAQETVSAHKMMLSQKSAMRWIRNQDQKGMPPGQNLSNYCSGYDDFPDEPLDGNEERSPSPWDQLNKSKLQIYIRKQNSSPLSKFNQPESANRSFELVGGIRQAGQNAQWAGQWKQRNGSLNGGSSNQWAPLNNSSNNYKNNSINGLFNSHLFR